MFQVLYICQLSQNEDKDKLSVVSVSEFLLKDPLLSFTVLSAKNRTKQPRGDGEDEGEDGREDVNGEETVENGMYLEDGNFRR